MSASPSPTPPKPEALPGIYTPQVIEIARPEQLEAAQRPPANKAEAEAAPMNGIQSATVRYFLLSNISVIVNNDPNRRNRIRPARKDLFEMAMEPFPDIVTPTLKFGHRTSDIPVEIRALQDHGVWTAEELQHFLAEGHAPKPHDSKRWAALMGKYHFGEKIILTRDSPFPEQRSYVKFFVNNALLCYTPRSQGYEDTSSQGQASELVVLSLSVSTGPQAMLDHAKSMSAQAPGGTYARQIQAAGTNRNALYQTGVNALVRGVVGGILG